MRGVAAAAVLGARRGAAALLPALVVLALVCGRAQAATWNISNVVQSTLVASQDPPDANCTCELGGRAPAAAAAAAPERAGAAGSAHCSLTPSHPPYTFQQSTPPHGTAPPTRSLGSLVPRSAGDLLPDQRDRGQPHPLVLVRLPGDAPHALPDVLVQP